MARRSLTKLLFESPSIKSGEEAEIKRQDFDFERKLGEGAFGQVWKVRHKVTNENFAMKTVPKEKVMKMLPQFKREVYIMYNLNHPHIIKLFNHFEDEKYFYLIMEFAEGGNLFSRLHKQRQFMELEAAQYFREISLAVEYLHSHIPAIIHRDIKPENILLDKDSRVVLTDFGWSNYCIEQEEPRKTVCGTLEYLPPQMVEQRDHDTSVDVWCLGVLLYEMLVGYSPFKSQARKNILSNISRCKPKFPLSFPQLAKDLILKMLMKNKEDRVSIEEVRNHRWLQEMPALKSVITQVLQPIPLPQYHESIPVDFKTYKAINKLEEPKKPEKKMLETEETKATQKTHSEMSDLSLSDSDMSLSVSDVGSNELLDDLVCKESVRQFQQKIQDNQNNLTTMKTEILEIENTFRTQAERVKELEVQVRLKEEELKIITSREKQLEFDIQDTDMMISGFSTQNEEDSFAEKIHQMQKTLYKKSGECGVLNKKKQSVLEQITELQVQLNSKEAQHREHLSTMNQFKLKQRGIFNDEQGKLSELNMNKDILNTRLSNHGSLSRKLQDEEEKEARSIIRFIETQRKEIEGEKEQKLREAIQRQEEKTKEKERQLVELKVAFEEKKSEILKNVRRVKDALLQKSKEEQDLYIFDLKKQASEDQINLKAKIQQIRSLENHGVSQSDIQVLLKKYNFLKNRRKQYHASISKMRQVKFQAKEKIRNLRKQKEQLSLDLNEVKIRAAVLEDIRDSYQ